MKVLPKNKVGGVVSNTVMGVGGLVLVIVIILVVTSTILSAGLFTAKIYTPRTAQSVTDVNETGSLFGNYSLSGAECSLNGAVINETGGLIVGSRNYSVITSSCTIKFISTATTDAGKFNNTAWIINSTTLYDTTAETTGKSMQGNFTKGIANISGKIPTILLIVAVVFLFGALILLIRNSNLAGIGGQQGSL